MYTCLLTITTTKLTFDIFCSLRICQTITNNDKGCRTQDTGTPLILLLCFMFVTMPDKCFHFVSKIRLINLRKKTRTHADLNPFFLEWEFRFRVSATVNYNVTRSPGWFWEQRNSAANKKADISGQEGVLATNQQLL